MHVVVLSDTHAPRFWKSCPPAVADYLHQADLILHAGDVCTPGVLDELARFAPVRVVRGNNDGADVAAWGATDTAEFEIDGLPVAMIHDSGPREGRLGRMRRRFPRAELVIFGHSHIPMDESTDGLRILNPGSATDKRRQPCRTLATLDISDGRIERAGIVELP
jgi:putative phosphoesterase